MLISLSTSRRMPPVRNSYWPVLATAQSTCVMGAREAEEAGGGRERSGSPPVPNTCSCLR